jgi:hypothetical protein
MDKKTYKPTCISFIGSLFFDTIFILFVIILNYLMYDKAKIFFIIIDILSGLNYLHIILTAIVVHTQRLTLSSAGIIFSSFCNDSKLLPWFDFDKAEIREKHNIMSRIIRVKRIVVFYKKESAIIAFNFNTSTLSKTKEEKLLLEIRKRIPTSTIFERSPSFFSLFQKK